MEKTINQIDDSLNEKMQTYNNHHFFFPFFFLLWAHSFFISRFFLALFLYFFLISMLSFRLYMHIAYRHTHTQIYKGTEKIESLIKLIWKVYKYPANNSVAFVIIASLINKTCTKKEQKIEIQHKKAAAAAAERYGFIRQAEAKAKAIQLLNQQKSERFNKESLVHTWTTTQRAKVIEMRRKRNSMVYYILWSNTWK